MKFKIPNFYIPILLISSIKSFELDLVKDGNSIPVVYNNTVAQYFIYNYDTAISSSCKEKIVHYEIANNNRTVFKTNNTIDNIQVTGSEDIITTFEVNHEGFVINHSCNDDFDDFWGVVNTTLIVNNEEFSFQFIKFCDNPGIMGSIITICIIFSTAILVVIISTYSELKYEFSENNVSEDGEIKNWHIFIFLLLGSAVLVMIFFLKEYINVIFTIVIFLQSTLAVYLTIKNLLEYSVDRLAFLKEKLDIFCFHDVEIQSIIVYSYTFIVMSCYIISKYWVLNNILGFSLVFTILSLFHIKNLKICALLLICAFCYDAFWVYISPFIFTQNVMVIAATTIDLPIKFEFPILMFNHPLKSCMYLGLGDLVLPGFVIKFCRRFDFIKNTNVYYKFSIILYTFALICSALGILLFNYPQPVLFYMAPILLFGIGCLARKRQENEIWKADVLEEQIIEHMALENCTDIESSVCSSDSTE
jgi:hypothetical protein